MDDDFYAFECGICGLECLDGEGDGETCDDCLWEEEQTDEVDAW